MTSIEEPQQSAVVTVEIDATPERVWRALATDDGFASWMGDGAVIDAVEGGEVFAPDPVGGRVRRGVVDDVTPGERLVYRWWPDRSADQTSTVSITIEPCQVGTRLTVVERPITSAPVCASASPTAAVGSWSWRLALLVVAVPGLVSAARTSG